MTPLPVSVVIPAYKAARTIRRAVDSALHQTAPPAEILVVDDGSPDGEALAAALTSYDPSRVRLLRKPNGGASSARNHGLDHATQDWVAFLDADDYWEPRKLELQYGVVTAHPEVGLVGGRYYEECPGQARYDASQAMVPFCGRVLNAQGREAFEVAMVVWTTVLMIRRDLFREHRFESGLEPAEDRDLWVRIFLLTPSYLLHDILATYVQEPGSISRTNLDRDCGNMLRVIHRYPHLLGERGLRDHEAIVERRWAAGYLAGGQPKEALAHALKRLKLQVLSLEAWWVVLKSAATAGVRSFSGAR